MKSIPGLTPAKMTMAQIRAVIKDKKADETVNQFCARYPIGMAQYYTFLKIVKDGSKKSKKMGRPKGTKNKPKAAMATAVTNGISDIMDLLIEPGDMAGLRRQRDFFKNELIKLLSK